MATEARVVSVIAPPKENRMNDHTWWTVVVIAKSRDIEFRTEVICHTLEAAKQIKTGYTWVVSS